MHPYGKYEFHKHQDYREAYQEKRLSLVRLAKGTRITTRNHRLGSIQVEKNQSRRFELLGYPQPSPWSRSAPHLSTSQMVINSQDPHLQQILRDDALAVCLELFHVPLRVDEAAAEVLGAGEGEVEGCGGGESSWIGIGQLGVPLCWCECDDVEWGRGGTHGYL